LVFLAGGISIKRSVIEFKGEDVSLRTLQLVETVARTGLKYCFFDWEGLRWNIPTYELESNLDLAESFEKEPVLVLPVCARSNYYDIDFTGGRNRLDILINYANSYKTIGFRLKAGTPEYLEEEEKGKDPKTEIVKVLEYILKRCDPELFVSSEEIPEKIRDLILEYDITPLLYLNKDVLQQAESIFNEGEPIVLHTPFAIDVPLEYAFNGIFPYMIRLKDIVGELVGNNVEVEKLESQVLMGLNVWSTLPESLKTLLSKKMRQMSLSQENEALIEKFREMVKSGVWCVIGAPFEMETDQVRKFAKIFEKDLFANVTLENESKEALKVIKEKALWTGFKKQCVYRTKIGKKYFVCNHEYSTGNKCLFGACPLIQPNYASCYVSEEDFSVRLVEKNPEVSSPKDQWKESPLPEDKEEGLKQAEKIAEKLNNRLKRELILTVEKAYETANRLLEAEVVFTEKTIEEEEEEIEEEEEEIEEEEEEIEEEEEEIEEPEALEGSLEDLEALDKDISEEENKK